MTNQNQKPDLDAMQLDDIGDDFDADQIANDDDHRDEVEEALEAASNHCFPEDADHGETGGDAEPHRSSQSLIANWMIDHRLGDRLKPILDKKPHCLLIEPPDATWCEPIAKAIRSRIRNDSLLSRNREYTITPDDCPSRRQHAHIREKAINSLSRGNPLVLVFNNAHANIPSEVLGIVDEHVQLSPLTNLEAIAIIEEMTKTCITVPGEDLVSGLSFEQICGAIRINDTPTAMLNRLNAMRKTASKTKAIAAPPLDEMVGYGEAKEWGLRLAREVDRYRKGEIDLPGETLFAQSLAVTCAVPIVVTSVAKWLQAGDGHLGDVMNEVKRVFDDAHQRPKPAILFLDECDAFTDPSKARDRTNWWSTLRAGVLTAIDGASTEPGLIIVGACNYPDQVDEALRRSGRLDRQIRIPLPNPDSLASMLKTALGDDLPDIDYDRYGQLCVGSTGADIARYVREIRARARDHGRPVSEDDVAAVLSPPDHRPGEVLHRIAIHESGHAIVAHHLGRTVRSLSLGQNLGLLGGYAISTRPHMFTRETLEDEVMICLAGRAAEIAFGLEASSGASADLAQATDLLTRAHAVYGFGRSLTGFGDDADTSRLLADHPELAAQIDADLHRLWLRTTQIIDGNIDAINDLAHALIEHRHLDETQFLGWATRGDLADRQSQAC
jgi:cell division protease FtsH